MIGVIASVVLTVFFVYIAAGLSEPPLKHKSALSLAIVAALLVGSCQISKDKDNNPRSSVACKFTSTC